MELKLSVEHKIVYQFTGPVFLEPHILRMIPKTEKHCLLESFNINVSPKPSVESKYTASDGAQFSNLFFTDLHERLEIAAKSDVTITEFNPYSFIVTPDLFLSAPFPDVIPYEDELKLFKEHIKYKNIIDFVFWLLSKDSSIVGFLNLLINELHKELKYCQREFGNTIDPSIMLDDMNGSCRDMTALFISCCRHINIPARYVSGYYYPTHPKDENWRAELHSWAEVYIPGAGWIGCDPTLGILCSGYHISLVSSHDQFRTLPVEGTFRGDSKSKISYSIDISKRL